MRRMETYNTGKAAGDDGETTKVAGLKSSVLTRATLTVVPVTDNNPLNTTSLVVTSRGGDSTVLASENVLDLVGLTVLSVDGTDQHVVRDVVKVTTVLEPWASHGDVISSSLALALDQDRNASGILAVPRLESSEELKTVTRGGNGNLDTAAVGGRSLVGVAAGVVATAGETVTSRGLKLELLAILVLKSVGEGVEVESTSNAQSNDKVGGSDESVGSRVGIVTTSEVTVVRRDNGVGGTLLDILAVPLSNARTAGVGEDDTTELLKGLELTVTLNGSANLLGTRSNSEDRLGLQTVVESILGDGSSTRHILVRRVGARANQTDLELLGPAVGLDSLLELRDGSSQVRGEGTVDVGLELGQVDLDQLVVLSTLILAKVLGVGAGEVTNLLTLGSLQVVVHAVVEGEERGGGTNLSTHVTDGGHTSGREGVDTRTVVLNDGTSTTLDSQETSDLEDDI